MVCEISQNKTTCQCSVRGAQLTPFFLWLTFPHLLLKRVHFTDGSSKNYWRVTAARYMYLRKMNTEVQRRGRNSYFHSWNVAAFTVCFRFMDGLFAWFLFYYFRCGAAALTSSVSFIPVIIHFTYGSTVLAKDGWYAWPKTWISSTSWKHQLH